MRIPRQRGAVRAATAAVLPLALAGCGAAGAAAPMSTDKPRPAADKARERVRSYLDAVKAKDAAQGRSQFCPQIREAFDQSATGPDGDFADHFTVPAAVITGVRPSNDGRQEVDASVTVRTSGKSGGSSKIGLRFTVAEVDGKWCIAAEVPHPSTPSA